MKKTSWKYIVAACSACLFLFTASANAGLLTFDTLGTGESVIPSGYGGLQWDNFYSLDGLTYGQPSGYTPGVVSKSNVAYNGSGAPASIFVDQGSFTPVLAYLTAAWNDNLKVQVKGYLRGRLVLNRTYTLSATKPMLVVFGPRVDELDFSSSGGTAHSAYHTDPGYQFAMDNLLVLP